MSAPLEILASELRAAMPDLRVELTAADSGGDMLELWLGDRVVVVEYSPTDGFVLDDDPEGHPFESWLAFVTTDVAKMRDWVLDALMPHMRRRPAAASVVILDAYAAPLQRGDPRAERAIAAIEASWAVHLVVEIDAKLRRIRHDVDRAAYLTSEPGLAYIATPDDEPSANVAGLVEPGLLAPGGVDELHVLGHLPVIDAVAGARGLEQFATALEASWAMLTPDAAHGVIIEQVIGRSNTDAQPPAGLPRLDAAEYLARDVPRRLGWINYWSDAAAAGAGFAESADDAFAVMRRVSTGWIVQLTTDPLDLDRPDHLAALRHAYERFPRVGRAQ